jgi:hypothetical protein
MVLRIEKLIVLIVVNVTWFLHISNSGEDRKKFKYIYFSLQTLYVVLCFANQIQTKPTRYEILFH